MKDKKFRRSKNIEDRRDRSRMDDAHEVFAPAPGGLGFVTDPGAANSKLAKDLGGRELPKFDPIADLVAGPMSLMGGGSSRSDIRSAIVRAAQEEGVDPSLALAIAERESAFNPRARNSKTIRGLFQMTGGLRSQYGIGDSDDPYTQAKGWARFIKDTKGQMASRAGRDVSDQELYSGHHFGSGRAGRMLRMDPSTPVDSVFTRYEMSLNPHFARAGTVGNLLSSVISDIGRRQAKYGGSYEAAPLDLSDLGEAYEPEPAAKAAKIDLSDLGDPYEPPPSFSAAKPATMSKPAASSAMDLSDLGVPVS
jgi:hypothetical protein